jgi:hypothetical protein
MYYYEIMDDGTAIGLYDATQSEGPISEENYYALHDEVAKREHPVTRSHLIPQKLSPYPLGAIENARVRTAVISTYRIHPKKYFFGGSDFSKNWEPRKEKIKAAERFSPPGTIGYYFGLTLDAALDEAHHYAGANTNFEQDNSKLILLHRTYYQDLLYLAPVLPAIWEYLGLPTMPPWEMYIAVMTPHTANKITDSIGMWAREHGFKGIIFPSARYGQQLDQKEISDDRFPILNFVEIGSHLCEQGIAIQMTLHALFQGVAANPRFPLPALVYSEPNLVIFDGKAVAGLDRPVFYATYNMQEVDIVKANDERAGLKHEIEYGHDEKTISLYVDDPKFKFMLTAPRSRPGFFQRLFKRSQEKV